MFSKLTKFMCVMLACAVIAACQGKGGTSSGYGSKTGKGGSTSHKVSNEGAFWGDDMEHMNPSDLLERKTFYFDYDTTKIHPNYMRALKAHANYLKDHPSSHIRLEGHTDERGSTEYNIALGERRAQAIKQVLVADGAKPSQISIVSYGKEKPAMQGHGESTWKYNRRGVVVYESH